MASRILSVSAVEQDHIELRGVVGQIENCEIEEARTYRGALLRIDKVRVVVCETGLPDGTWKDILETVSSLPDPPLLIVTSRFADERLWAEVLNLGGYDVLIKPFDPREVFRSVTGAMLSGQREIMPRRKDVRSHIRSEIPMKRSAGAA
jgi:DNA-binding response OmpR family regulator